MDERLSERISMGAPMADGVFKCGKCRQELFPSTLVVAGNTTDYVCTCLFRCESSLTTAAVWYLSVDGLQDVEAITQSPWIEALVHEAGWTKGKLLCPKCKARLGAFDFVSMSRKYGRHYHDCPCCRRITTPMHVIKSKVDYSTLS